ncbi:MAG: transcription termination factor NusA, partial [Planctomycetota bacterium]
MNPEDVLKWVDTIHQEKNIERELIFEALETALSKAAGKKLVNIDAEPAVIINRETGDVTFYEVEVEEQEDEEYNEDTGEMEPVIKKIRHIKEDEVIPIDPGALGRVAAQTAKQVIIQRIREAERDAIYDEYADRKGDIVSCTVQRVEANNNIICTLDNRTEAFFPRWEQVRDEHYDVGERVKSLILDVKKSGGQKVKIILSRTHPNFVRKLFEQEVPEIADHTIDIKALVREPGYRSKVAVSSIDPTKIDPVGACVGVRGSRIKGIIDELNGEKIDIIRWNDSAEVLIQNALKPAAIASITLDYDHTKARVVVPDDQLSLAIGKGGQNVRLASRLSGWDIDIMSQAQERALGYRAIAKFQTIPTVDEELATRLFNAGYTTFDQLLEAGPDMLRDRADGVNEEHANGICEWLENVDEEEYYREVVVDLPPELAPVSPAEKMARLFGGGGGGGGEAEGEGADLGGGAAGNGGPRSATELFSKKDAPAGA